MVGIDRRWGLAQGAAQSDQFVDRVARTCGAESTKMGNRHEVTGVVMG